MITPISATGYTHVQTNAGAFLTGFDYTKYNTATALKTAIESELTSRTNLLGMTRGGGSFSATPTTRSIDADGKRYEFVGSTMIDSWDIKMTGTLLELTAGTFAKVLGPSDVDTTTTSGFSVITVRTDIEDDDYIDKLVWVGDTADGLMLIELDNALATAGATFTFTDKGEGTLPFTFTAHQDSVAGATTAPFKIVMIKTATT